MAIVFGLAPASFAATQLTQSQLEGISAGDWVVIDPSTEQVWDVYHSNNTLDLKDESQKDLQAVSNANAVDSAIAVQTNIASVTGQEPSTNVAINGYNEADILNYNPAEESSSHYWSESSYAASGSQAAGASATYTANASASASAFYTLDETLNILETFDLAYAAAAAYEKDCKGCEEEFLAVEALIIDADYILDYDKHVVETASASVSASETLTASEFESSSFNTESSSSSHSKSHSRNNLSENNHLDLKDTAQQNLQAVSNLNAVGSAAAIQTNIASNVGVTGTITHTNIATVVNGL